jgi:hypothetical protein
MDYEVGDVIEYRTFTGNHRRVLVEYKEADVKNGRPGFDGTCTNGGANPGMTVWGYDDQITRVVSRAVTA